MLDTREKKGAEAQKTLATRPEEGPEASKKAGRPEKKTAPRLAGGWLPGKKIAPSFAGAGVPEKKISTSFAGAWLPGNRTSPSLWKRWLPGNTTAPRLCAATPPAPKIARHLEERWYPALRSLRPSTLPGHQRRHRSAAILGRVTSEPIDRAPSLIRTRHDAPARPSRQRHPHRSGARGAPGGPRRGRR
jgi:hypothetical protein